MKFLLFSFRILGDCSFLTAAILTNWRRINIRNM